MANDRILDSDRICVALALIAQIHTGDQTDHVAPNVVEIEEVRREIGALERRRLNTKKARRMSTKSP